MPRRPLQLPLAVALLAATAAPAAALAPSKHRSILEDACDAVGLPHEFCRYAGRAAYQTDYEEWSDLAAHAQRELGQDRCPAADAAATRLDGLGRSIVTALDGGDYERAATDLGRAIHTLQDECAHHGMTNQEHAFYSMEQMCGDGDVSPDVQPEAIACAKTRTADAMRLVADAVALAAANRSTMSTVCSREAQGGPDNHQQDTTCATAILPTPVMGCRFLAGHKDWDGVDSTWNSAIVGPVLFDAFAGGLSGVPSSSSACLDGAHAIDPVSPRADRADRDVGCLLTDIGCLGSADDPNDGDDGDPYDDDDPVGCQGGRGGTGVLVALAVLVLAIRAGDPLRVRRRRR